MNLDFTSALYLGLQHPSHTLRPWSQLTTGKPPALALPHYSRWVARTISRLMGCDKTVLLPSTLHGSWDLFVSLAGNKGHIFLDAGAYPIIQWGVERASARGTVVRKFLHHNVDDLERKVRKHVSVDERILIVADGFCPLGHGPLPIGEYLAISRRVNGLLVIDDTQAFGILGAKPSKTNPYGIGGGGTLPWNAVGGSDVLVMGSLAKGFGVPIAFLSGSTSAIREFRRKSQTAVHCSGPSFSDVYAAKRALAVNQHRGESLRKRLLNVVSHFRFGLKALGIPIHSGRFPFQTLAIDNSRFAQSLHARLFQLGIKTVLHHPHQTSCVRLSFVVTNLHELAELDYALDSLKKVFSDLLPSVIGRQRQPTGDPIRLYPTPV